MMHRALTAVVCLAVLASGQGLKDSKDPEDSGNRYIEYEIDGSVHSASITYTDSSGDIKQKDVELPYAEKFYAPIGTFVSIMAQKKVFKKVDTSYVNPHIVLVDDGEHGTVHVLIRVSGAVLKEDATDSPFGIAKASGKVENRKIYY